MHKISLFCRLFDFEIKSVLEFHDQAGKNPFLMMLNQKIFDQVLIFVNLYQHVKNQFIPSIHSSKIVSLQSRRMTSTLILDHANP